MIINKNTYITHSHAVYYFIRGNFIFQLLIIIVFRTNFTRKICNKTRLCL